MKPKRVERTVSYREDLDAIEAHIAIDSPRAALEMWLLIDEQVDQLATTQASTWTGGVHS